jgi:hypothetical protein
VRQWKKGVLKKRLKTGQLERKDILVKSDKLNKDRENKRKIVKKKKKNKKTDNNERSE